MRGVARLVGMIAAVGVFCGAATLRASALADSSDAAAPPGLLSCEPASKPGRVRCEARVYVAEGESIAWGDVVLLAAPSFVSALRGRIGPHDATIRSPTTWRWEFALVARANGGGDVVGRARLVVCREKACLPRELPLVGRVVVGVEARQLDGGVADAAEVGPNG
jgi:hypothetical protein